MENGVCVKRRILSMGCVWLMEIHVMEMLWFQTKFDRKHFDVDLLLRPINALYMRQLWKACVHCINLWWKSMVLYEVWIKYLSRHVCSTVLRSHGLGDIVYNQSCINYYGVFNSIWCIFTWTIYKHIPSANKINSNLSSIHGSEMKSHANWYAIGCKAINSGLTANVKLSMTCTCRIENSWGHIKFKSEKEWTGTRLGALWQYSCARNVNKQTDSICLD